MPSLTVQNGLWTCRICGSTLAGVLSLEGWRLQAPADCRSAELCSAVCQQIANAAARRARAERFAAE